MDTLPAVPHRLLTPVWISLGVAVLIGAGFAYSVLGQGKASKAPTPDSVYTQPAPTDSTSPESNQAPSTASSSSAGDNFVSWDFTGSEYRANGTAPTCPTPLFSQAPVDTTTATGLLYPGQTRGDNYKPHGGFRFDNATTTTMSVIAPFDGFLIDGARFIAEGSLQYTFDFVNSCGLKYRVGHLLEITPQFQAYAEEFPEAKEGDSRTTFINPPVFVSKGTSIATAIGIAKGPNVFMDWGVYDLRKKNAASADPAWQAKHTDDTSLAPYAICWLNELPTDIATKLKALPPGDPTSGTTSDYCHE